MHLSLYPNAVFRKFLLCPHSEELLIKRANIVCFVFIVGIFGAIS